MNEDKARELWMERLEAPLSTDKESRLNQFLLDHPALKIELETLSGLWTKMDDIVIPEPSERMHSTFERYMEGVKASSAPIKNDVFEAIILWTQQHWKVGLGALAMGLFIGIIVSPKGEDDKVDQLASEVSDLKKMMVLSLIEKPQAQDRIRAVSMVSEVRKSDYSVVEVLISTMNTDNSINVRLAAIDALIQYGHVEEVREAMIQTISEQESPLILVALADALVQIKAKGAASEFQKVIDNENVDTSIKSKLESTIQTLKEI